MRAPAARRAATAAQDTPQPTADELRAAWRAADLQRRDRIDAELLRPLGERGHDVFAQSHPIRALLAQQAHASFTRQAHTLDTGPWRGGMARLDEMIHLPLELVHAAERLWIDDLHENGRAPAFLRIRATESGEPGSEPLDEQSQPVTLVAGIEPTQRKQRTLRLVQCSARIVSGIALRVDDPGARQL